MSRNPRMHPTGTALLGAAALICAAACSPGGGSAVSSAAARVFEETVAADPEYATYAIELAADSDSELVLGHRLEAINGGNYKAAQAAIRSVAGTDSEAARLALRQAFETKKGLMRLLAAQALARFGDEEAIAWIREEVAASPGSLTPDAALVLAELGDQDTVKKLVESRMKSDDPSLRNEAYALLGEIRQPWSTAMLTRGLEQERGEDRQQAIVALGRTGDPGVAPRIERFANTKGLVFATIESLGALGNPSSAPLLKKLAAHEEKLVRIYAGVALERMGETEAARETIEPLLADEDPIARLNLAEQLGHVESGTATGWLRELAKDESRDVQVAALRALVRRSSPEVAPTFRELLEARNYEVVALAATGLAQVGGPDALPALEPLLEDKNPYVKLSAANAVLSIETRVGAT